MKVPKWNAAALLAFAVSGCGEAPESPDIVAEPARLPPELCAQTEKGLAELQEKGGIQLAGKGEVVMMEEAWFSMSASQRSELTRLIAFNLACGEAGPSAEHTVTFRSKYGRMLSQQIVDTRVDIGRMLED